MSINQTPKISEEKYNTMWVAMVSQFKEITENNPAPEKVKDKLLELKDAANQTVFLTGRQREGIHSRIDNYLNGTYGVDAKKDAYNEATAK